MLRMFNFVMPNYHNHGKEANLKATIFTHVLSIRVCI